MIPLYDLNPHLRFPWFTLLIIVANVGVMLSQGLSPNLDTVYEHGVVPKRISEVGSGRPVAVPAFRPDIHGQPVKVGELLVSTAPGAVYTTLLTAMFLHGGWFHLIGNMWFLWIFGNNVEDRLGHVMYLCFYLLGGVIASMCHWALHQNSVMPMIGASGAIAAVLGGYAITYPWAKVRTLIFLGLILIVDLPALVVLGAFFLLDSISGILSLGAGPQQAVAFWAHIGGFVAGLLLMPFMSLGASPPGTDWRKEAEEMFRFDDPRSPRRD